MIPISSPTTYTAVEMIQRRQVGTIFTVYTEVVTTAVTITVSGTTCPACFIALVTLFKYFLGTTVLNFLFLWKRKNINDCQLRVAVTNAIAGQCFQHVSNLHFYKVFVMFGCANINMIIPFLTCSLL